MRALAMSLGLLLVPEVAVAQVAQGITGNVLLSLCTSSSSNEFGTCNGIVGAVADIAVGTGVFDNWVCPRPGVTYPQYTDVVISYLKSHPESRDQFAVILVSEALSEAFPCR